MKILEKEEFFDTFKEKGMTFDQWLEKFEKEESKAKTNQYFEETEFIRDKCSQRLGELNFKIYLLAVVADWCGDCQRNVPILEHICQSSDFLELKLLKKEDNMDLLLKINGGEKIPYVMFYSQDGYFSGNWIERSYDSYKFIADSFKKFNYEKSEDFFKFYSESFAKEKNRINQSTCNEIIDMILKVNAIQGSSTRINKKE